MTLRMVGTAMNPPILDLTTVTTIIENANASSAPSDSRRGNIERREDSQGWITEVFRGENVPKVIARL
jgi:hypothetical protein